METIYVLQNGKKLYKEKFVDYAQKHKMFLGTLGNPGFPASQKTSVFLGRQKSLIFERFEEKLFTQKIR